MNPEHIVITILLHLGGAVLGLILVTPTKPPKRWTPGQTKDTALNGKHRVRWIPLD